MVGYCVCAWVEWISEGELSYPRRVKVGSYNPINYAPIPGLKVKSKRMNELAKYYLERAAELFHVGLDLDTAVRDTVLEGLAYLVHTGYDCQGCAVDIEEFSEFRRMKTEEWFRSRGCAEWFCVGAGCLFNSSKPRIIQWAPVGKRRGVQRLKAVEVA
jgi:hypothetical protein